jgi:hypothetical protein
MMPGLQCYLETGDSMPLPLSWRNSPVSFGRTTAEDYPQAMVQNLYSGAAVDVCQAGPSVLAFHNKKFAGHVVCCRSLQPSD